MSPGWQNTQITDGSQLSGTKVCVLKTVIVAKGFFTLNYAACFCLSYSQCSPFPSLSFPILSFLFYLTLHMFQCNPHKLFGICTISLQIGTKPLFCSQSCCKKHLVSVSFNPQVPNTWLWWIWTCDWELCLAQKVAEKNHCNWAWNTFIRCMTFRQMVKVSLYATNMLHFLNSCVSWFIWLPFYLCIFVSLWNPCYVRMQLTNLMNYI